jgi:hypothetical protein
MTHPRWLTLTLTLLAASALVCSRALQSSRRRRASTSPAKPEPLQTWENEGGGVPVGNSRMAAQVETPHR